MSGEDDRDPELVAIGTAGDPIEGAMVREYLASCGIDCVVQGEHHRSMLQMVGAFIELRLLVPRYQAEEAVALLREFRERLVSEPIQSADGEDPDDEDDHEDSDVGESEALEDWRKDAEITRRVRGARLLSLVLPGLGLAHFAVGARTRGCILLASWPAAFMLMSRMGWAAMALIPLSAAFDFIAAPFAMADVLRQQRERVPRARAVTRSRRDDDDHMR
jgi:hypothetical protein